MIVDNLLYFGVFVFLMMIIGMVLTVIEFTRGEPKRQRIKAERDPQSVADFKDSTIGRPAR